MEMLESGSKGRTIRLDEVEYRFIRGSLSEVIEKLGLPDWRFAEAFEDRIGFSLDQARELLDGIDGPQSIGADGRTFVFSLSDLRLLRNAMIEVAKGEVVEGWELHALIAVWPEEGRQVLAEFERLLTREVGGFDR